MVKEEDAPRINRIVERFQFASVTEAAQIKTEIEKSREEKAHVGEKGKGEKGKKKMTVPKESESERTSPELVHPEKSPEDQLMDELFGEPAKKEGEKLQNPSLAEAAKSRLSEPILEKAGKAAEGTSSLFKPATAEKESVREKLHEIQARKRMEAEGKSGRESKSLGGKSQKSQNRKSSKYRQSQAGKKSKKAKAR